MKENHRAYSAGWKPFLGAFLALCFLATSAHAANPRFQGTFNLTHEVRWGKYVMAPGQYSLALDESTHTLIVRDASSGKVVARNLVASSYFGNYDASELIVTVRGEQRAVSAVRLAGIGLVYETAHPFPRRERAVEASNTEAVIQIARN